MMMMRPRPALLRALRTPALAVLAWAVLLAACDDPIDLSDARAADFVVVDSLELLQVQPYKPGGFEAWDPQEANRRALPDVLIFLNEDIVDTAVARFPDFPSQQPDSLARRAYPGVRISTLLPNIQLRLEDEDSTDIEMMLATRLPMDSLILQYPQVVTLGQDSSLLSLRLWLSWE